MHGVVLIVGVGVLLLVGLVVVEGGIVVLVLLLHGVGVAFLWHHGVFGVGLCPSGVLSGCFGTGVGIAVIGVPVHLHIGWLD